MDGQSFLDDLRSDHETALSRLGSSKSVYALTGGEMDGETVESATAREIAALESVVNPWADEATGDAADLFESVLSFAANRVESLDGSDAGEADPGDTVVAAGLQNHEGTIARVGALAGGLLVLGKLSEQLVGFFVGDADRAGAEEFREFRSDVEGLRDDAAELLESLCDGDDDWETARTAADDVVDAAYDWYVETLESMGVKPKNVC